MPNREEHLRQADRFEAFLKQISPLPYKEWIVIVSFHIALHYVDALLAERGSPAIEGHTDRSAKMTNQPETRAIQEDYHQLYKDAKGARYLGDEFAPLDLEPIARRYERVRRAMPQALGLTA